MTARPRLGRTATLIARLLAMLMVLGPVAVAVAPSLGDVLTPFTVFSHHGEHHLHGAGEADHAMPGAPARPAHSHGHAPHDHVLDGVAQPSQGGIERLAIRAPPTWSPSELLVPGRHALPDRPPRGDG